MAIDDTDAFLERRRMRRQVTRWRIVAAAIAILVIAVAAWRADIRGLAGGPYVARLNVNGTIVDDPARDRALRELARDNSMSALIVRIDSPGGTVAGSEALYRQLRVIAQRRPVVAVMAQTAASGGYMTALAADHIIAREGTITGSIGVLMQVPNVVDLLGRIGVHIDLIKSDPLKAQPSPLEPLTPEARAAAEVVVRDMYDMFLNMVVERRRLERERARVLADGRIYTGRQAREAGLIDGIGGEDEARAWLAARGVARELRVRDVEINRERGLVREVVHAAVEAVFGKTVLIERLTLDGPVALWHPSGRVQ
ncbi:MAG: signal peptide peptidase SppA [Alphaproteobacteria bacterium]|nr:signal peptide peptidase SppA [Alphaproteobacteria bacterium]